MARLLSTLKLAPVNLHQTTITAQRTRPVKIPAIHNTEDNYH